MRTLRTLFLILGICLQIQAQTQKDVFIKQELTWYGIDFSLAKFVGDFDNISFANNKQAHQIRDEYFKSWNNVVINENSKFDIPTFYKKQSVQIDLASVEEQNLNVDSDSMMYWGNPKKLSLERIQATIEKYKATNSSNLGLVFIVEKFDKTDESAIIHIVFFDTKSKNVLLLKKLEEKPGGIGLRNYWVKTIYNAMSDCSKYWNKWKKEAK